MLRNVLPPPVPDSIAPTSLARAQQAVRKAPLRELSVWQTRVTEIGFLRREATLLAALAGVDVDREHTATLQALARAGERRALAVAPSVVSDLRVLAGEEAPAPAAPSVAPATPAPARTSNMPTRPPPGEATEEVDWAALAVPLEDSFPPGAYPDVKIDGDGAPAYVTAGPAPTADDLRALRTRCHAIALETTGQWLGAIGGDAAQARAVVYGVRVRNEERAKVLAEWELGAERVLRRRALLQELCGALGEAMPAEVAADRVRDENQAMLRAREVAYVERETELLALQASVLAEPEDLGKATVLARAAELEAPTPEVARSIQELRAMLSHEAPPVAEVVRACQRNCLTIASETTQRWLDLLAAPDEAHRMAILLAIQNENRLRGQELLAWQTALASTKRRRYALATLRRALAGLLPETQEIGDDVELLADAGEEGGPLDPSIPPPVLPPAPEFTLPKELLDAFTRKEPPPATDAAPSGNGGATGEAGAARDGAAARESTAPRGADGAPKPGASVPPPGQSERRNETRRLALGESIVIGADHAFFTGFAENISNGGIFVATFELTPKVGERFHLEFEMPDGTKIAAHAEVRWLRTFVADQPDVMPGIGLRFVDLKAEDEATIEAFIRNEGALFFEE